MIRRRGTVRARDLNACEILLKAAEVLDDRGWTRGLYENRGTGEVCAVGALRLAAGSPRGSTEISRNTAQCHRAYAMLQQTMRQEFRTKSAWHVQSYNDDSRFVKNKNHLQTLLRRAAGVAPPETKK